MKILTVEGKIHYSRILSKRIRNEMVQIQEKESQNQSKMKHLKPLYELLLIFRIIHQPHEDFFNKEMKEPRLERDLHLRGKIH
jgi:hypothetical protein